MWPIPPDQWDDWVVAIVAVCGVLGAAVGAGVGWIIKGREARAAAAQRAAEMVALQAEVDKLKAETETSRLTAILEWADQMRDRLAALEAKVDRLEKELDAARDQLGTTEHKLEATKSILAAAVKLIDGIGAWLHGGQQGPCPTPDPTLHAYIDQTLWIEGMT